MFLKDIFLNSAFAFKMPTFSNSDEIVLEDITKSHNHSEQKDGDMKWNNMLQKTVSETVFENIFFIPF